MAAIPRWAQPSETRWIRSLARESLSFIFMAHSINAPHPIPNRVRNASQPIPETTRLTYSVVMGCQNRCALRLQISTSMSITGTSMRTPTTVASAAPDDRPNSITEVAIATSK